MNDFNSAIGIGGAQAVLSRAAREIKCLREQNRDMRTRLKAFDDMMACFDKRPIPAAESQTFITHDVLADIDILIKGDG